MFIRLLFTKGFIMMHFSRHGLITALIVLFVLVCVVGQTALAEEVAPPPAKETKPAAEPVAEPVAPPAAEPVAEPAAPPTAEPVAPPKAVGPAKMPVATAVNTTEKKVLPAGSTKLIELPKLNNIEINEISAQLVLLMGTNAGYSATSTAVSDSLLETPSGVIGDRMIARSGEGGTYILRFGYRQFITQPPQFWVLGVIIGKDGNLAVNPELELVEPEIKKMLASLNTMRAGLTVKDLEAKIIQLSYVDATNALTMLQGFGITTGPVPPAVDFAQLPYVMKVEDPTSTYTGLVGAKGTVKTGSFGLSMSPGDATEMSDNAIGTPLTQLLVMFDPAHPEQFSRVRRALDEHIDRPARQIFIEGMVLEISETGLKDLGVDWSLNSYTKDDGTGIIDTLRGGSLSAGSTTDTLEVLVPNMSTFQCFYRRVSMGLECGNSSPDS